MLKSIKIDQHARALCKEMNGPMGPWTNIGTIWTRLALPGLSRAVSLGDDFFEVSGVIRFRFRWVYIRICMYKYLHVCTHTIHGHILVTICMRTRGSA